jgi:hypothetical protein
MATELWSRRNQTGAHPHDSHRRAPEVISTSGGIMRSKFPSRKNGRLVHCEGLLELDAAYLFESNPRIVQFREQPITITYPDGARIRRYTPDFELALTDGQMIWVEIKPLSSLARADVKHKLARVAEHLARIGQPFVILNDALLVSIAASSVLLPAGLPFSRCRSKVTLGAVVHPAKDTMMYPDIGILYMTYPDRLTRNISYRKSILERICSLSGNN